MYVLLITIILIACITVFFYQLYKSCSKEKLIIESFIRKYVSYIRKFTTIYENILQGENKQAEQNLVNKTEDINDILVLDGKKTLLKVIRDQSIYRRIVNLDGYFSRIKEWEKTISASDLKSAKSIKDSTSISRMLQAFLGDVHQEDGSFYRYDFKEHIEDVAAILDYLNRINTNFLFRFLALLSSRPKEETAEVGSFIAVKESELDSLRWRLEKLRLLEEKYLLEQRKSLATGD
ncbi:MAG: hypothetical protein P8X67_08980 [Syntrophobacterales bacterium]|jgi:hypothetical protein